MNGLIVVDDGSAKSDPNLLTHVQFMDRFTAQELRNIYGAAKSAIDIEIFLERYRLAGEVSLRDTRTADGLHALEAATLIGAGRSAEILKP